MIRCERCSHPLESDRASPFARELERLVCEECEPDEVPDGMTVLPRAEGGAPL